MYSYYKKNSALFTRNTRVKNNYKSEKFISQQFNFIFNKLNLKYALHGYVHSKY